MSEGIAEPDDPYLWLESIDSPAVIDWIEVRNPPTLTALADADVAHDKKRLRAALGAPDKIPYAALCGDYLYNLFQDEAHPRGLWRRTTMASYCAESTTW